METFENLESELEQGDVHRENLEILKKLSLEGETYIYIKYLAKYMWVEKKKFFNFFKSDIYEDESKKIEFKKYELFKFVNFINTNPFQVWGQKRARFVRVLYSLVKDKKNSKGDRTVYKLFRKETSDIKNETFKEPEIINRKKPEHPIRTHLVAKNIKELFIEYTMPKTEEQKKQDYREEEKEFKTFVWGKEKETKSKNFEQKNIVPQYVSIRVTFWDDDFKEENTFQCMFPIFSYKEQIEKKDDKKKDGAPNKKESNATDEKK